MMERVKSLDVPLVRIAPRVIRDAVTTSVASVMRRKDSFDWPGSADQITEAWLTTVLVPPGNPARVTGIDVLSRSDGTTNRLRLGLSYEGAEVTLPPSVFVKFSPNLSHRIALNASGMTDQETWFYRDLRPLASVATPQLLAAESHPASGRFVLVLEDLAARGVTFNDATRALTRDEADRLIDALASLHAGMWENPRLQNRRFSTPVQGRYADFFHLVNRPFLRLAIKRGGLDLIPAEVRNLKTLQHRFWQQLALDSTSPVTMIHGDCHAGNVYFDQAGMPGLYDWQLVRRGSWGYDLGYCLMSVLAIDDRRAWERDLLARYFERLREHGVAVVPSAEEGWRHYRRQSAYGLVAWLETLGLGDFQEIEVTSETVRRFGQAAKDHGLLADESLWT